MRILHVLIGCGYGGITNLVRDLVVEQKRNSAIQVAVLIINKDSVQLLDTFKKEGITLHVTQRKSKFRVRQLFTDGVVKTIRLYDIIHLHSFNPILGFVPVFLRKKIVFTEHGNFGFFREIRFKEKANRTISKYFFNYHVSYLLFNSKFTQKESTQLYGLEKTDSSVVYNGVRSKHFSPHSDEQLEQQIKNKFVVGITSRLVHVKRIDRLIEAFSVLLETRADAVLLIVGDGVLRTELSQQAVSYGITEKVIFLGYKDNITYYQSLIDVFVMPSIKEAFGLVAIEVFLLGKPLIVYDDGGGLVEIVQEIEPLDIVSNTQSCVDRLIFYAINSSGSEKLINRRVEYAKQYSIERMEQETYRIYQYVMSQKK